jgi:hypothetical protein
LAEPNDEKWVTEALGKVPAANKVPGAPADMVKTIGEKRDLLVQRITTDLGVDAKTAADLIDVEIVPALNKLASVKPPLFFIVTTPQKLRELTKNTQWGEPRYHYNRVSDSVAFDDQIAFSVDKEMDDTVLPSFYDPAANEENRMKDLRTALQSMDERVAGAAAGQVNTTLFSKLVGFTDKQFEAMKLKPDQEWFAKGASTYLAAGYLAAITGLPKESLLNDLVREDGFPVSMRSVELANPDQATKIQTALQPYYAIAKQRKATLVISKLVNDGGESVIANTIKAMRAKMPADGRALVTLITETTHVDLTNYVGLPAPKAATAPTAPR